jgi:putative DNA methylase
MTHPRKKLIEVALPLEAINKESAREKSIRHGHPSTLHLWWARRPLAACRAVLFASLVDDPASCPEEFPSEAAQNMERERLFDIIEQLVKWENSTKESVLLPARTEIARSAARAHGVSLPHRLTPDEVVEALRKYAPPVLDPFAGGGSIPLEAQRLGLEALASDLNPVAVLINKALIEIPPKFANRPPVHPVDNPALLQREWHGAQGLAEDVRYYGRWMRDEAWKRIGHLYPKVTLPKEQGGGEATVIAWLWARTVKCPNPACGAQMPLVRSFVLSTKKGREVYVEPIIDAAAKTVRFEVRQDSNVPEGTVNRQGARCIVCNSPVPFDHVRAEGQAGRMGAQMLAIVAEGKGGRAYLSPSEEQGYLARTAEPTWAPETDLPKQALGFRVQLYGMTMHRDLFTSRQLLAVTTFSDLVGKAHEQVLAAARQGNMRDDGTALSAGGAGALAYADAVATYLSFAVDRLAESSCLLARWQNTGDFVAGVFARQAISMMWDFAEVNPFSSSTRNFLDAVEWVAECFEVFPSSNQRFGVVQQADATAPIVLQSPLLISTDPPYYDNVPYADLSDFFYIWLRFSLGKIYPNLFSTLLVPKSNELVAEPFRHGSTEKAQQFFEDGLGTAFSQMWKVQHAGYPLTVYYAFKQADSEDDDYETSGHSSASASTGWETMLEGLIKAGFRVNGTWPMRTERGARTRSLGSNALASSIVLVCRPRAVDATLTSRGEFLRALKRELPVAIKDLQRGNIAPVDLAQAAIGPGMAVFSRYSKVLEADGSPMRVRTALQLINQALDEVLAEQEGEYDGETRWAVAWFEQYGMEEGPYGVAETLSKAKNTAVERLAEAGILVARGGKVRLLRREEMSQEWNPARQQRLTVWEVTQRLIRALKEQGEQGAAAILDHTGNTGEIARDLAYRLYTTCERKGWAQEALDYNTLVVEWRDIADQADHLPVATQAELFD